MLFIRDSNRSRKGILPSARHKSHVHVCHGFRPNSLRAMKERAIPRKSVSLPSLLRNAIFYLSLATDRNGGSRGRAPSVSNLNFIYLSGISANQRFVCFFFRRYDDAGNVMRPKNQFFCNCTGSNTLGLVLDGS